MRVHVIHATLRIVFGHKEGRVLPDAALREDRNDAAQGKIVVSDKRDAIRKAVAWARRGGVVIGQAGDNKPGDLLLSKTAVKVALTLINAVLVGNAHVEGGVAVVRVFADRLWYGSV